jgi:anti-anti-sigma regulatory factor
MLKITAQDDATRTVLELEGKLAGLWVEELKDCWQKVARGGRPVRILLCAVTFVDEQGIDLLTEMYRDGAELVAEGCMNKAIVEEIQRGARI